MTRYGIFVLNHRLPAATLNTGLIALTHKGEFPERGALTRLKDANEASHAELQGLGLKILM